MVLKGNMKMYKTYNIRPKRIDGFEEIPEELQVIFQWQKIKLGADKTQTVTTCLFRDGINICGQGFSIENPNDERDEDNLLGKQWAFKRATKTMLKHMGYLNQTRWIIEHRDEVEKSFRLAFYKARNSKAKKIIKEYELSA